MLAVILADILIIVRLILMEVRWFGASTDAVQSLGGRAALSAIENGERILQRLHRYIHQPGKGAAHFIREENGGRNGRGAQQQAE